VPPLDLTPRALARMAAYDWPGNVRELRNFIERSLILGWFDLGPDDDTARQHRPALKRWKPSRNATSWPPAGLPRQQVGSGPPTGHFAQDTGPQMHRLGLRLSESRPRRRQDRHSIRRRLLVWRCCRSASSCPCC
jgi:DNA-binding NtrC family response regulator